MKLEEFAEVVRAAGFEPPQSDITIAGADPIYRSPMRLGSGMAAALGMVGSAIDDIWYHQTGKRQQIKVDLAQSARFYMAWRIFLIDIGLPLVTRCGYFEFEISLWNPA
jgi:hypothetical protein